MTHPYRTPALGRSTRYGRHCRVEWLNDKQLRVLSWWVLPFFGECLHRLRLLSPSSPHRALHDHRGGISLAHVDMPVPTRPEPGKVARRSERLSRRLASLAHDLRRFTGAPDEALPEGPAPGKVPRYVSGTGTLSPARVNKPMPTRPEPGKVPLK